MAPIAPVEASGSIVINSKLYPIHLVYDGVIVMGEIINNFTYAVTNVNFSITFYDEGSNVLKKVYSQPSLEVIPAGRRASFEYPFNNEDIANFKSYDVSLVSYQESTSKDTGFSIITEVPAVVQYTNYTEVQGLVVNTISENLTLVTIFALFYDENGFIGVTDSSTIVAIEPSDTGTYDCFSSVINSTFNIVKCIITGESQSYGIDQEYVIANAENQSDLFNRIVIALMIIGLVALLSSMILLQRKHKKQKHNIKSRLSKNHSTSKISKHFNSLDNYNKLNNMQLQFELHFAKAS